MTIRPAATLILLVGLMGSRVDAEPQSSAFVEAGGGVAAFRLDRTPVTNEQFLAFVAQHPAWRRDRVAPLFAEPAYLSLWAAPDALGDRALAQQPVVFVSWFAARAFCAARGMRLPTEAEWERAAAASPTRPDASADPAWRADLLALYTRPSGPLPRVAEGAPNFWGIYDLHGVVWEWVDDFASAAASLRGGCGAAADGGDAGDFPAFERRALRSSLRASYAIHNLGFRCAAST